MVRKIFTAGSIKSAEESAFADGISADELMFNAGCSVADEIARDLDVRRKNILVLCGNGNNGGDGFVCAKRLSEMNAFVYVCLVKDKPVTKQAKNAFKQLPEEVTVIAEKQAISEISEYDIIIDAIFGFGFHGTLDDNLRVLIGIINSTDAVRVAIDVPSGAECDTGHINNLCFKADMTVTFTKEKPFCYLYPAREYAGTIRIRDVGIPEKYTECLTPFAYIYEKCDAVSDIPFRKSNSNKGTFGSVLCATGSENMMGAAVLRSKARLRSGIGICYQMCFGSVSSAFLSAVPEAVCADTKSFNTYLQKAKAVICGCGLGKTDKSKEILEACLLRDKPLVLDADALNILSECDTITIREPEKTIITPHPAEAARLMGVSVRNIVDNRFRTTKDICEKYGCTVLLKGANTIIAGVNRIPVIIPCANSGLAKGGSGDTLTGIIGALAAQNINVFERTCLGAYIHAQAGQICRNAIGEYSMQPSDLIDTLPQVFKNLYDSKPVRNYFIKE